VTFRSPILVNERSLVNCFSAGFLFFSRVKKGTDLKKPLQQAFPISRGFSGRCMERLRGIPDPLPKNKISS